VGQNFGAKQWRRIHRCFAIGSMVMLVWGILVTLGLYFGGYHLTGLFLKGDPLQTMGAEYLHILALCQTFMCVEGVSAGLFRGCGRTVPPSAVSITSNVIRVPLAYLLSQQMGLPGVYWAVCLTCMARGAVIILWRVMANRGIPQENMDSGPGMASSGLADPNA
jgi:Na+-driven multidrug efflux pump